MSEWPRKPQLFQCRSPSSASSLTPWWGSQGGRGPGVDSQSLSHPSLYLDIWMEEQSQRGVKGEPLLVSTLEDGD